MENAARSSLQRASYEMVICSYHALQRTLPADLIAKPPNGRVPYLELKCSLQFATDRFATVTVRWASLTVPCEMMATGRNAA